MRNLAGKELALFNNFTYYRRGVSLKTERWSCTAFGGGTKCKARLIMTKYREIIKAVDEHNHTPPFSLIKDGVIIKF